MTLSGRDHQRARQITLENHRQTIQNGWVSGRHFHRACPEWRGLKGFPEVSQSEPMRLRRCVWRGWDVVISA
jgi:hypothetical protein